MCKHTYAYNITLCLCERVKNVTEQKCAYTIIPRTFIGT